MLLFFYKSVFVSHISGLNILLLGVYAHILQDRFVYLVLRPYSLQASSAPPAVTLIGMVGYDMTWYEMIPLVSIPFDFLTLPFLFPFFLFLTLSHLFHPLLEKKKKSFLVYL